MRAFPRGKNITKQISELNPKNDHQEIAYLLTCHSFYWDIEKALEFALFKTFAIPSISKLLSKTGEFKNRPRKRYDDTELIMYEIIENGYDSERAEEAFRRMNAMHNSFDISNDDMLYVLSTFTFTPIDWIENYGWRKLTENEKLALFYYYKGVGTRMNIKNIPENYTDFKKFHIQYEKENFIYSETNKEIGVYSRNLILGFYLPKFLYFIGKPFVSCFMSSQLIEAMGFKQAPKALKYFVDGLMKFRAKTLLLLPEKKSPRLGTKVKRPTYPEGYHIKELGTFSKNKNTGCKYSGAINSLKEDLIENN